MSDKACRHSMEPHENCCLCENEKLRADREALIEALTQSGHRCDECTDHVVDGAEFRQLRKIREAAEAWKTSRRFPDPDDGIIPSAVAHVLDEILAGRGPT